MKIEKITEDYWAVEDDNGSAVGDVLGGGPTKATRYKAITPNHVATNPAVAPGPYFATLNEAARWLAVERFQPQRA